MIYKKSVVLSSVDGGREKAVVNLSSDNNEVTGTVRLYNFDKEPAGILSLGILCNKEVLKAGLVQERSGVYSFKLNTEKDLTVFSCAVINLVQGEAKPLLLGASGGISSSEEKLASSLHIFDEEPTVERIKEVLDQNDVHLEEQEEIDKLIEKHFENDCDNKCAECKYRDAFFKLEDDITYKEEEKQDSFFDGVKEQIESLFNRYPEDEILKQIIPNSKWVKIDYEDKGEYYVVGLLYENDKIKYVCYGVPSTYSDEPPKELKGFAGWLPIDAGKEQGFGYWITYQDAESGETVKLNYELV